MNLKFSHTVINLNKDIPFFLLILARPGVLGFLFSFSLWHSGMCEISGPGESHESLICFQINTWLLLNMKSLFRDIQRSRFHFFPPLTSRIARKLLLKIKHRLQFKLVSSRSGPVEVKAQKRSCLYVSGSLSPPPFAHLWRPLPLVFMCPSPRTWFSNFSIQQYTILISCKVPTYLLRLLLDCTRGNWLIA